MRIFFLPILVVSLIGIFTISSEAFAEDETSDQQDEELVLPSWIKNIADLWYNEKIGDETFLGTIEWLISKEIIILPNTDTGDNLSNSIPAWIKNNAGWWANGEIDDQTFVNGLQYLVQIGLIQVYVGGGGGSGGGGGGGGGGY